MKPRKPRTGAQREAKRRASGRAVACVLRDPRAIESLDALAGRLGGVTAAVSHALVAASSSPRPSP